MSFTWKQHVSAHDTISTNDHLPVPGTHGIVTLWSGQFIVIQTCKWSSHRVSTHLREENPIPDAQLRQIAATYDAVEAVVARTKKAWQISWHAFKSIGLKTNVSYENQQKPTGKQNIATRKHKKVEQSNSHFWWKPEDLKSPDMAKKVHHSTTDAKLKLSLTWTEIITSSRVTKFKRSSFQTPLQHTHPTNRSFYLAHELYESKLYYFIQKESKGSFVPSFTQVMCVKVHLAFAFAHSPCYKNYLDN